MCGIRLGKADSDLRVSFFGTPDADDILYLFSDVIVCDKLITYAITKDSFFRAIELGLTKTDITAYLGNENDSQFSLWQQAFSRLRLYDGILINCTKDILGSSVHGICQARVLEWGAIAFFQDPI